MFAPPLSVSSSIVGNDEDDGAKGVLYDVFPPILNNFILFHTFPFMSYRYGVDVAVSR